MKNAQKRNPSLVIARKFCRKHWTHRHQWRIKRWVKGEILCYFDKSKQSDFQLIIKRKYR